MDGAETGTQPSQVSLCIYKPGGRKGCVRKVKRENLINVIGASLRRRAEIKLNKITVRSAETERDSPLSAGGVLTRRARLSLIPAHRCSCR